MKTFVSVLFSTALLVMSLGAQVPAETTREKLHRIIPKIDFSNTPVTEAIDFLHQRSIELDTHETAPDRKGVEFGFSKSSASDEIAALRISNLRIRNVPLNVALNYICAQTKLRFTIEGAQVMLIPQAEYETEIHRRTLTVPVDFLARLAAKSGGGEVTGSRQPIRQYLERHGIAFPEGASATHSGNQLEVANTRKCLDQIEQILVIMAAEAAADPSIQFRWLQTDPKTADAMVELLKANTLSAAEFSAKIEPQIKGGKITEVAAFDRKVLSGERFVLRPANDKLPMVMEAESTLAEQGFMELRCVPEWYPKTPLGSALLRSNTATIISRQHWYLFSRWGDAKSDTLLLACGGSNLAKPQVPSLRPALNRAAIVIHLDAEWRETSAVDLAKVTQAPPESRAKALVWLRGRSTLLASTTGSGRSGQKSAHEYLWGGKSDAELNKEPNKRADNDIKEPPPRPGVIFQWEPAIMAAENPSSTTKHAAVIPQTEAEENQQILSEELSLRLSATYMPLKSRSKSQEVKYEFRGNGLKVGVPVIIASTATPPQGQAVAVLVITPWYDIIR